MKLRESVQALILDEIDSVLLVRFDWPGLDPDGGFWANPGGGIESGESRTDALARELLEEVGLVMDDLGPEVWTKTAQFPMPGWDGQVDHIHLMRVAHFPPAPRFTHDKLLAENLQEIRWWSREDLAGSTATFSPRAFPRLLAHLLDGVIPTEPVALTGF